MAMLKVGHEMPSPDGLGLWTMCAAPTVPRGRIQLKPVHSKPERACCDPLALRLPLAMGLKPTEVLKAMTRAKVRHLNAVRLSSNDKV